MAQINTSYYTLKDGDDPEVLPYKGLISASGANWCVFCGVWSRNPRKRKTCNIYKESEWPVNDFKTLQRVFYKLKNKTLHPRLLNHIECTIYHSKSCI